MMPARASEARDSCSIDWERQSRDDTRPGVQVVRRQILSGRAKAGGGASFTTSPVRKSDTVTRITPKARGVVEEATEYSPSLSLRSISEPLPGTIRRCRAEAGSISPGPPQHPSQRPHRGRTCVPARPVPVTCRNTQASGHTVAAPMAARVAASVAVAMGARSLPIFSLDIFVSYFCWLSDPDTLT